MLPPTHSVQLSGMQYITFCPRLSLVAAFTKKWKSKQTELWIYITCSRSDHNFPGANTEYNNCLKDQRDPTALYIYIFSWIQQFVMVEATK